MEFFHDISEIWNDFYSTLQPTKQPPNFWKIQLEDWICFFILFFSTLFIWLNSFAAGEQSELTDNLGFISKILKDPIAPIKYWDGPNYLFVAATLYNTDNVENPWTTVFQFPDYYLACHLPGYPLFIRFCSFFSFGNLIIGGYISILLSSFLLIYVFRRVLIVYNCSENPLLLTCLLPFIPTRLTLYHSVPASEPLFLSFVCFSLIFYKLAHYSFMIFFVWLCCITRIEGMAVGATYGFCFLLLKDIPHAAMMFLTFVPDICLVIMHKAIYGEWMAYFKFNQKNQGIIQWPPMNLIISSSKHTNDLTTYSFIAYFLVLIFSWLFVIPKNGPAAILSLIFILYIPLLFHIDIYRYGLPASVFCFLIGLDKLWSSPKMKNTLKIIWLPYFIFLRSYAAGQITSNSCMNFFMPYVTNPTKESYFH